ncbi:MAG: hypothetical protein RLY87_2615 [Chloroflexota bacterium]|jgi:TfoX/Sxy family transcriptional regulator of competence genes
MVYSIALYERLCELLPPSTYPVKRMFGGVVFFRRGHMLVGVFRGGLMVRVSAEDGAQHLKTGGIVPLASKPNRMQGFIVVDESLVDLDHVLEEWVEHALSYNATLAAK